MRILDGALEGTQYPGALAGTIDEALEGTLYLGALVRILGGAFEGTPYPGAFVRTLDGTRDGALEGTPYPGAPVRTLDAAPEGTPYLGHSRGPSTRPSRGFGTLDEMGRVPGEGVHKLVARRVVNKEAY